jgi:bifunctional DNA-binding transcriptional regulator/antitoxin component of YhaV-PrlF toxin-antitoxin module
MNMTQTITITSKGQTTLPVAIRRRLGIGSMGGKLQISFNEERGELIVSKPVSAALLSEKISSFIKPGTPPLIDVDDYYQLNRGELS